MDESGKVDSSICTEDICNSVKKDINEAAKKDKMEQIVELNRIYAKYLNDPNKCIFKRNLDGTNLMLWKEGEYKKNRSIEKLYNIFTQRVTTDCLMNEFIEDNKCELKDIQAIAGIMNQGSENIENIEDIKKTLNSNNEPGLKSSGKLTMKGGGDIPLFNKFFKINMALMYNDELMNEMSNTTKEIITKYIIAGINGYRELVTFAFEKAYDVQCQQDFLFFLIKNTVNTFDIFKNNIWPFIMANAPILINDIRKGIDTAKKSIETANTVAENINKNVSGYIDKIKKESNQKELGVGLGQITTEKLNEERNKALEREARLQLIKQIYDEKIAKLKMDTAEIKKKQQDADEETKLIKSYEQEFAEAFVENEKAKKALDEVNDELQEMIDDAITDNSNIISLTTNALESGRKVASEVYPHTNSVLNVFLTNEEKKTQEEKVLTTKLRRAEQEKEATAPKRAKRGAEEGAKARKIEAPAAEAKEGADNMDEAEEGDNIRGGTRKKRTSRKGKKKASKNRKTKARRARKSRKTKK